MKRRPIVLILYLTLLFLPIYWMLITSFKTDHEIMNRTTLIPMSFTLDHYKQIFTVDMWRDSFINSIILKKSRRPYSRLLIVSFCFRANYPAAYSGI